MFTSKTGAKIEFDRPVSYQTGADGKRVAVNSHYRLYGRHRFGFEVGRYDQSRTLVIDPVLVWGTYLGGSGFDYGAAVAIDSAGSVYVTGRTQSADFPVTAGAYQTACGQAVASSFCNAPTFNTNYAFVSKFNPQGTQLIYSTYIGGSVIDGTSGTVGTQGNGITVDGLGNAHITGRTSALDFPTTSNAVQRTKVQLNTYDALGGICRYSNDTAGDYAFVTKLNATGSGLLYSTLLGGSGQSVGQSVAVNAGGEIYVVGTTYAATGGFVTGTNCNGYTKVGFPLTSNAAFGEVPDPRTNAVGFLSKIGTNGALAYSTYVTSRRPFSAPNNGSDGVIQGLAVAVDATGNIFLAGDTQDGNFGGGCAYCSQNGSYTLRQDQYIMKFRPDGTVAYGPVLIGGSSRDYFGGMAIDNQGNAYVAGTSLNYLSAEAGRGADFPTTSGVYQTVRNAPSFNNECPTLAKFSPTGTRLWSTFVCGGAAAGNTRDAYAYALAVDPVSQTPVIGGQFDPSLPLVNSIAPVFPGGSMAFLARLSADGATLLFSSGVSVPNGGDYGSYVDGIAIDSQSNVYTTGGSLTSDGGPGYMATPGAFATSRKGDFDVVVSKVSIRITTITIDRASLNFGVRPGQTSPAQVVNINATAGLAWTATPSAANIQVNPPSGTGPGSTSITATTGASGTVTFTAPGARSQTLAVNIKALAAAGTGVNPSRLFGVVDQPGASQTTGFAGAVPVTGWALDDVGVAKVSLYREPIPQDNPASINPVVGKPLVYIGDSIFLPDTRPDVAGSYPNNPQNYRAGWGMLFLTNTTLNNGSSGYGGNGTYVLHIVATSVEGFQFELGARTITVDNTHSRLPFGTIDTPAQGEPNILTGADSNGKYVNFGWALTNQPNVIPTDASTMFVVIDGARVGVPAYGYPRADIDGLFPGYQNTGKSIGAFLIDTTAMASGIHSIAWSVRDNGGNLQGIGSRVFYLNRPGGPVPAQDGVVVDAEEVNARRTLSRKPKAPSYRTGPDLDAPLKPWQNEPITLKPGERLELHTTQELAADQSLPICSTIEGDTFFWQPPIMALGDFPLTLKTADGATLTLTVRIQLP